MAFVVALPMPINPVATPAPSRIKPPRQKRRTIPRSGSSTPSCPSRPIADRIRPPANIPTSRAAMHRSMATEAVIRSMRLWVPMSMAGASYLSCESEGAGIFGSPPSGFRAIIRLMAC